MAEMGPMSGNEMPNFNILGLLIGGRGYAANWFSQRDALALQQQQRAERQTFAGGLLASPELKAANANPYDRNAQYGLWGKMYGGPADAAQLGSNMLQDSVKAIYGREASSYDDALARGRIRMTAEEELRVDEVKRSRDAAANKALVSTIFGPDGQTAANQFNRNRAFTAAGGQLPAGMDVMPGPGGGLVFRPAPGSEQFREMTGEINANTSILSSLNALKDMHDNGTGNKGAWDTERKLLQLNIQRARKLGSLDQGTMDFLDETIPGYYGDYTLNPANAGQTKEKLRVLIGRMQEELKGTAAKWLIPADQIPKPSQSGWAGDPDMSKLPKGPARAAAEAARKRADEVRGQSPRARAARAAEAGSAIGGMVPQKERGYAPEGW